MVITMCTYKFLENYKYLLCNICSHIFTSNLGYLNSLPLNKKKYTHLALSEFFRRLGCQLVYILKIQGISIRAVGRKYVRDMEVL